MTERPWGPADWLRAAGPPVAAWYASAPAFRAGFGEHGWSVLSGADDPDHNWVTIHAAGRDAEFALRARLASLRGAGLAGTVCVLAETEPELVPALAGLGLTRVGPLPHFALDLASADIGGVDPPGFARVDDEAGFRAVMAAIGETFQYSGGYTGPLFGPALLDNPALRFWAVRESAEIASVCVTWHEAEQAAYVVIMATRPAWQGRGLGRALLLAALRRERDAGARRIHLVASDEGARLYRKLGFIQVAEHALWTT